MAGASKTIVFDVDDVLCDNKNRNYENAVPIRNNIVKLNGLHDMGYRIVLHTARGMVSCNGDVKAADEKNRAVLEKWLADNGVMYDELVFGKPIAMMYVDDKCMTPDELKLNEWYDMHGGSGSRVQRMGKFVKKDLGDREATEAFQEWVSFINDMCFYAKTPEVVSYTYDEVVMKYVDGNDFAHLCVYDDDMRRILEIVEEMAQYMTIGSGFDMEYHVGILDKNNGFDKEVDRVIEECKDRLMCISYEMKANASFCHGDMTLSNIIKESKKNEYGGRQIFLIDPCWHYGASSYLLDLAKLKMSLDGYEERFGFGEIDVAPSARSTFKDYLKAHGVERIVQVLELMYVLRLTRYRYSESPSSVLDFVEDIRHDLLVMERR